VPLDVIGRHAARQQQLGFQIGQPACGIKLAVVAAQVHVAKAPAPLTPAKRTVDPEKRCRM